LSDRKGICICVFDWSFARLITLFVTITSIVLSSSKIQNGDIVGAANPDPPGKMAVKIERERECLLAVQLLMCVWSRMAVSALVCD